LSIFSPSWVEFAVAGQSPPAARFADPVADEVEPAAREAEFVSDWPAVDEAADEAVADPHARSTSIPLYVLVFISAGVPDIPAAGVPVDPVEPVC
jgi:hypothetical protein